MEETRACPELELIERRCRTVDTLGGDESQMLYLPCVMLQICKACVNILTLILIIQKSLFKTQVTQFVERKSILFHFIYLFIVYGKKGNPIKIYKAEQNKFPINFRYRTTWKKNV